MRGIACLHRIDTRRQRRYAFGNIGEQPQQWIVLRVAHRPGPPRSRSRLRSLAFVRSRSRSSSFRTCLPSSAKRAWRRSAAALVPRSCPASLPAVRSAVGAADGSRPSALSRRPRNAAIRQYTHRRSLNASLLQKHAERGAPACRIGSNSLSRTDTAQQISQPWVYRAHGFMGSGTPQN